LFLFLLEQFICSLDGKRLFLDFGPYSAATKPSFEAVDLLKLGFTIDHERS